MKPTAMHHIVKFGLVVWVTLIACAAWAAMRLWGNTLLGSITGWVLMGYLGFTLFAAVLARVLFRFRAGQMLEQTSWDKLPPGLQKATSEGYPELEALGFELGAYAISTTRAMGTQGAILELHDASRTIVAWWLLTDAARAGSSCVELSTDAIDGKRVVTGQGNEVLPMTSSPLMQQFPQIADLRTRLAIHQRRVAHHLRGRSLATVPRGEENIVTWMNEEEAKDMERKAALGFFRRYGEYYRPTIWFVWTSAFCAIFPFKWLPRAVQKWRSERELRQIGWDGQRTQTQ